MPLNLTSNDRQKPRGVGEKLLQSSTMEVSFPSLQFNTTTGRGNPDRKNYSLEFKFCRFPDSKIAEFKFHSLHVPVF